MWRLPASLPHSLFPARLFPTPLPSHRFRSSTLGHPPTPTPHQPRPSRAQPQLTPTFSQQYLDAITRVWGDWALFQQLLTVLRQIGDRHGGMSIANIAVRWVLDHPFVGAVLVGTSEAVPLLSTSSKTYGKAYHAPNSPNP